jgi:UDP-glucose 4-epimerase
LNFNNIVLVTGASGFLASKLIQNLHRNGRNVRCLVHSLSKNNTFNEVECDLSKADIPDSIMKGVSEVYHLAALTHDKRDPEKISYLYHDINVRATEILMKIAIQSKVEKFIFISSVKAGGVSTSGLCANEVDQKNPEGVYGKTKREAELKLLKMGRNSNIHVSIIRPSLVYGPNVRGNLELMLSAIKKGWFPPLPETGNRRSMIHVDDLVRSILLVANDVRANGEIFIATGGIPNSSREIYNAMCSALGKSIPKWSVPKFLFDMISLINPRIKYKLNKLLGDECYSSAKLEKLGFKAKKTLRDINETDF